MTRHHPMPTDVFTPKPSRIETRADATTAAAQSILREEATAQAAKTERLRALRLAREADAPPAPPSPASKQPAKRSTRKRAAK